MFIDGIAGIENTVVTVALSTGLPSFMTVTSKVFVPDDGGASLLKEISIPLPVVVPPVATGSDGAVEQPEAKETVRTSSRMANRIIRVIEVPRVELDAPPRR
jgi:hypothetical protein